MMMNGLRDQFFSGSTLPGNEHGRIEIGYPVYQIIDLLHAETLSYQLSITASTFNLSCSSLACFLKEPNSDIACILPSKSRMKLDLRR